MPPLLAKPTLAALETPNRLGATVVTVITLAAFGPYVLGGLRTEQIAVYGAAGLLVLNPAWVKIRVGGEGIAFAGLWATLFAVAVVGALDPPADTTRYPRGEAFAGIDNAVLPLVVLFIVWSLITAGADAIRMVRAICRVVVWAMIVNSVLAVAAYAGADLDLSAFHTAEAGESVSDRAATLGRFSGLFGQPAEAGLMASIGILAAMYLYRRRPKILVPVLLAITVSGLLSVSKSFLLVGFLIAMWQMVRIPGKRVQRMAVLALIIAAINYAFRVGWLPPWDGLGYAMRLIPSAGQDTIGLYSAGRFGGTSTLTVLIDAVSASSPVFGFGAAGLRAPYDNTWVEAYVVAGAVGVCLITAVFLTMVVAWLRMRTTAGRAEARLAGGLVLTVIGVAMGIPSLTANRCATVVWLLLALLLCGCQASPPTARRLRRLENLVSDHGGIGGVGAADREARRRGASGDTDGLRCGDRPQGLNGQHDARVGRDGRVRHGHCPGDQGGDALFRVAPFLDPKPLTGGGHGEVIVGREYVGGEAVQVGVAGGRAAAPFQLPAR